jgi:alkylhydroperoxidase family enzyme
VWEAVERDWRTAPIDGRLRATLGFVEKLTLRPAEVTSRDADQVLETGVSRAGLADAIQVAALFSMIVRLADALGWDVPPFDAFEARADGMLASGYALD